MPSSVCSGNPETSPFSLVQQCSFPAMHHLCRKTPAISSSLSARFCHSATMLTYMHLTSLIEMHFWSPKTQSDSVPSVFSLLLKPLHCDHMLSHTYCKFCHCQHESPGPMVLGKLSLPHLLFWLHCSTYSLAARRRHPQRTRQQFLRDNTVLSFFLQHQISREAAGGVFWDLSQLLPTTGCFPKLLHSFTFIPSSPYYLAIPTIRKTEVLEC